MKFNNKTGIHKILHREKYLGKSETINYRSILEKKFIVYCEDNPNIISWNYEEVIIPYFFSLDNKMHRYILDFFIRVKDKEKITNYLIEIKPESFTTAPKKRRSKKYLEESILYAKNVCKWNAAIKYAESRNCKFKIITDKDL